MEKLRVLIAEDNDDLRRTIFSLLCKDFQIVGAVCDGEELFQTATCLLPDVIVSDITMPVLDGLTARGRLSTEDVRIPFVFISIHSKEVIKLLAKDSSAAFVYKGDILSHLALAIDSVYTGQAYRSPFYQE